jgi:hypothetical protein
MPNVSDFKAGTAYFSNAFQLVVKFIAFHLRPNMREDAITLPLPDVERFTVPWVDEVRRRRS